MSDKRLYGSRSFDLLPRADIPPLPHSTHADEFRKKSAECLRMAEITVHAVDKAHWLTMSKEWAFKADLEGAADAG